MSKRFLDDQYRLMAPGPVKISEQVREALSQPMVHHRTPIFEAELKNCLQLLKSFFVTEQPVLMIPSTGSGGMEAAVVNLFSPGDEVAVIVSGKFGQRWADMAKVYGLTPHLIDVPWGEAVSPETVSQILNDKPQIKGVFTQACETSTATWHPIQELAEIVSKYEDTLFIVDAITAVGCSKMPFDQWKIDCMVAGSQKAFALPTGLSFVCLSEKAWKANGHAKCPKYYFNLLKERQANEKGQTYFSSAVSHIRALNVFLKQVEQMGLDALIRRATNLSQCTQKAVEALGLQLFSKSPSPSVTAVCVPDTVDGSALRSHMEKTYNVTVMGGQDQLKGKIIRIGHMGDISNQDQLATLEALALSLNDLGFEVSDEKRNAILDDAEAFLKMCSNV